MRRYRYTDDAVPGLARDPLRGRIGGVCAGIARHFGWQPLAVRVAAVIGLFIVPQWVIIGYIALYLMLDERIY